MDNRSKPSSVRWLVFGIIFILVVINMMDRICLSIAMPTIAKEFALSPTMQGLVLSSFFWAYALLQVPGGFLIDKYGPRKLVTASTLFWGVFQTIAGFSTGGLFLFATRLGLGAAEAPLFPAGGKLNSTWLSAKERGRGAVLMDSGGPLGVALGGIIIAYLIAAIGSWRIVFVLAGLFTIVFSYVAWKYLRDTPKEHSQVNQAELALIESQNIEANVINNATSQLSDKQQKVPVNSMIAIMFGRISWAMINFGLLTWGPSYLAHARGFNLKEIGSATFIIFISGALGSLCCGFLADFLVKKGYRQSAVLKVLLSFSGLVMVGAFLLLPTLSDPIIAILVLSIAAFFLMWGSLYWCFPALLAPKNKVGIVGGTMNMAGSIGGIIVSLLVGLIIQMTGNYDNVLLFFSSCAIVFVLGTVLIRFNYKNS